MKKWSRVCPRARYGCYTAARSPFDNPTHHGTHLPKTNACKQVPNDMYIPDHVTKAAHVYEVGDCVYSATLNQTNVSSNNNKFYMIQVLQSDAGGQVGVCCHCHSHSHDCQHAPTHTLLL